jgi:hypothetical protein
MANKNPGPGFGQAEICGRVKPIKSIGRKCPNMPIIESLLKKLNVIASLLTFCGD